MLLTHTNMSPLESPSCEKSRSTSSSVLNENFSSRRAIKDSDLNSQKTQKMSNYTSPIFDMLITKEAVRGGAKI